MSTHHDAQCIPSDESHTSLRTLHQRCCRRQAAIACLLASTTQAQIASTGPDRWQLHAVAHAAAANPVNTCAHLRRNTCADERTPMHSSARSSPATSKKRLVKNTTGVSATAQLLHTPIKGTTHHFWYFCHWQQCNIGPFNTALDIHTLGPSSTINP